MVSFSIANEDDNDALCERMQQDLLEGDITVSFRRNPSFFHASTVQGDTAQVMKCTDNNELIGLGSRILLNTYINGKTTRTGYLSDLRLKTEHRGGMILSRAYRFLKRCHDTDPVPLYYSMILKNSHKALLSLTRSRCNLPHYRDIGEFLTPAIYLDLPKSDITIANICCRVAEQNDMEDIFDFIKRASPEKQFTPALSINDFQTTRLRGLQASDFYIALEGDEIVAVIAAWDQTAFRQTYIEKYNLTLQLLRPFYNTLSSFTPLKPLPSTGSKVPYFYLAFIRIKKNRSDLFRCLLRHLYNDRRKGDWNYFIAGLHASDPLCDALTEYRRENISGNLFVVHYPENENDYNALDERIPYIEISMI